MGEIVPPRDTRPSPRRWCGSFSIVPSMSGRASRSSGRSTPNRASAVRALFAEVAVGPAAGEYGALISGPCQAISLNETEIKPPSTKNTKLSKMDMTIEIQERNPRTSSWCPWCLGGPLYRRIPGEP